jgi:hypothetical protein
VCASTATGIPGGARRVSQWGGGHMCVIWCQFCILGQMARHTLDYGERKAVCCNAVGVSDWEDDEAYKGVESGHVGEGSVLVVRS